MGELTNIQWTDATWNPWHGCLKVSAGCANCYMYREKRQYGQDPKLIVRSKTTFRAPLKWKDPRRVFTCSWSDFFLREADAWRDEAWDIIRGTPHLTYQILTKRPERIAASLPYDWGCGYSNVILLVSAEDQATADVRIPLLLHVPAAFRGVSIEPLLGPIALDELPSVSGIGRHLDALSNAGVDPGADIPSKLDWVICGGESGPNARPPHPAWIRSLRDQCHAAQVPFFFKQWGEWSPFAAIGACERAVCGLCGAALAARAEEVDAHHQQHAVRVCPMTMMRRVGKKNAGRLLDGLEWSQFPEGK